MKISELRKCGAIINRQGMSKMAMDAVDEFDGSYKGVMELCGKLSVIAKMATCDDYWNEQVSRGVHKQEFKVDEIMEGK
ncbi:hypothetical protein [Pseudoalteromonas sp.]|uniref:hypothetical protein n=1 Tax=Pseudoalteromonas sp. TaxID=53249 RepID=UPI003D0D4A5E